MAGVAVSPSGLSLLAEFDDLNRCNSVLNDGVAEEYFLRFLEIQQQCQQQLNNANSEMVRLQKELQEALKKNCVWESKLSHARKLYDNERKHRIKAEHEKDTLEKQMATARDLLFNDNRAKLNDETLEKLAFLNNTSTSRSTHIGLEPFHHGRLNTITEMNSTGNLLSDQSFSRSEDDLDESLVNRRSWKRHRPSNPPMAPSIPTNEEHLSSKRRCSSGASKMDQNANPNRLVATTTVTVDRMPDGSGNGRITASSIIEEVNANTDATSGFSQQTPKSTKIDQHKKASSKGDSESHYSNNIKDFLPPEPVKPKKEPENAWTGVGSSALGSPRGPGRVRQHNFTSKTILKPEPCTTCGNRIRFAKSVVKCTDCRATCHLECREKLPLPCVPSHGTPNINSMGTIADYTPNVSPMVPALIIHCVNEVEARGLTEVGLYRIPGSEKEVKALKERFLKNKGTPPLTNIDINVICGCVKDFLRSLREPLITNSLRADFVACTEISDKNDSVAALYQAISELPQPNRDTLAFMMLHLQRVAECVECKMPIDNLAKVFGPTIVGYSDGEIDPNMMFQMTTQQYDIVRRLLELSSDYWARFAAVSNSDGSSVVATPPLLRTPSLRPRINTMPQTTPRPGQSDFILSTPSLSSKSSSTQGRSRGFFYTPSGSTKTPSKQRKFYVTPDNI